MQTTQEGREKEGSILIAQQIKLSHQHNTSDQKPTLKMSRIQQKPRSRNGNLHTRNVGEWYFKYVSQHIRYVCVCVCVFVSAHV